MRSRASSWCAASTARSWTSAAAAARPGSRSAALPEREVTLLEAERRKAEFERWAGAAEPPRGVGPRRKPSNRLLRGRRREGAGALARRRRVVPAARRGGRCGRPLGRSLRRPGRGRPGRRADCRRARRGAAGFAVIRKTGPTPGGFPAGRGSPGSDRSASLAPAARSGGACRCTRASRRRPRPGRPEVPERPAARSSARSPTRLRAPEPRAARRLSARPSSRRPRPLERLLREPVGVETRAAEALEPASTMWTRPALPSSRSTSAASESASAQKSSRAGSRAGTSRAGDAARVDRPDERLPFRRGRAHMRLETADRRGVAHVPERRRPLVRVRGSGARTESKDSPGPSLDSTRGRQDHRTGESEGWRRQDDDRDQPRRAPRGGGRAARCSSTSTRRRTQPPGSERWRTASELRPARRRPGRGARLADPLCQPGARARPPHLAGAAVELSRHADGERFLRSLLAGAGDRYGFVFLDRPPSFGPLTVNALAAADSVIVPVQAEYYALEGLSQLLGSIELVKARLNPKLGLAGILLTMGGRPHAPRRRGRGRGAAALR